MPVSSTTHTTPETEGGTMTTADQDAHKAEAGLLQVDSALLGEPAR